MSDFMLNLPLRCSVIPLHASCCILNAALLDLSCVMEFELDTAGDVEESQIFINIHNEDNARVTRVNGVWFGFVFVHTEGTLWIG